MELESPLGGVLQKATALLSPGRVPGGAGVSQVRAEARVCGSEEL